MSKIKPDLLDRRQYPSYFIHVLLQRRAFAYEARMKSGMCYSSRCQKNNGIIYDDASAMVEFDLLQLMDLKCDLPSIDHWIIGKME